MKATKLFLISLIVLGLSAPFIASSTLAGERITYKNIRAIMGKRCFFCHGSASPFIEEFDQNKEKYVADMKGPRMDSYETLIGFIKGEDAGAIMRRLDDGNNTANKKPGNMYIYLGETEEERKVNLEIFKAWIGYWTLKKKKDLTPDEISKILVPKE